MNLFPRLVRARRNRLQIGPSAPVVVGPTAVAVIQPPARFAWDEKGWTVGPDGDAALYVGNYLVWNRDQNCWQSFAGRLIEDADGIAAYVCDPPASIKRHSKGRCFQLTRAPWFRVHWHTPPENIDAALLYVEQLLDECINN